MRRHAHRDPPRRSLQDQRLQQAALIGWLFSERATSADEAVLNGTHGSTVLTLLAGKPILQLPLVLEQDRTRRATVRLGRGRAGLPGGAKGWRWPCRACCNPGPAPRPRAVSPPAMRSIRPGRRAGGRWPRCWTCWKAREAGGIGFQPVATDYKSILHARSKAGGDGGKSPHPDPDHDHGYTVPGMVPALSPVIAHKSLNDPIRLARMEKKVGQLTTKAS